MIICELVNGRYERIDVREPIHILACMGNYAYVIIPCKKYHHIIKKSDLLVLCESPGGKKVLSDYFSRQSETKDGYDNLINEIKVMEVFTDNNEDENISLIIEKINSGL